MGRKDMEVIEARIAAGEEKERKQKMKENKKKLKEKKDGFFKDFKKFITKGNIVDMAVGVIVGSAFTAIINALSNGILKPIINWILASILGTDSLSEVYTYLKTAYTVDDTGAEVIDLANSIYIDWGAFINAVINFFIVAFVLFCIVKIINRAREADKQLKDGLAPMISRADRKEMKKQGIKAKDSAAVAAYFAAKAEKEAAEKAAAEEKARLEREANPTTEDLLKKILAAIEEK